MMDMFGQTELTEPDLNNKKRTFLHAAFINNAINNRQPISYDTNKIN